MAAAGLRECSRRLLSRGLCDNHYKIAKRAGTLPPREKRRDIAGQCAAPDCEERQYADTWCRKHYDAARRRPERCVVNGCSASVAHPRANRCARHMREKQRERGTSGGQRKLTLFASEALRGAAFIQNVYRSGTRRAHERFRLPLCILRRTVRTVRPLESNRLGRCTLSRDFPSFMCVLQSTEGQHCSKRVAR
jgi:hypothetical protein